MLLEDLQRSMIAAIDHGPDHVVETAFRGRLSGTLRGFSVHANTISHARLIGIEDTFPHTRTHIGDAEFNRLSRDYFDLPGVAAQPHATLGRHFPQFLSDAGHGDAATLAAFEWAWLESYHAAEADALELAALSGLAEDALLQTVVALHPAARLVEAVRNEALIREMPSHSDAAAVLLTRPHAEVIAGPATAIMARQYEILAVQQPICNLLDCGDEPGGEDSLQAFFAMLDAGALVRI